MFFRSTAAAIFVFWAASAAPSLAAPLVLRCTASSEFNAINAASRSTSVLFKIDGSSVEIFSTESHQWVLHPCVYDQKDGQYCSVTPTKIVFKETHAPVRSITVTRKVTIDRQTGTFVLEGVTLGPNLFKEWGAKGTCSPSTEPPAPVTRF